MAKKEFQRPDEAALRRVLERYRGTIQEIILRLAWTAGLSAVEMHGLKWDEVDFTEGQLRLPDRSIPMDETLRRCLQARWDRPSSRDCAYVVTTDHRRVHMHRVKISEAAGEALRTEAALAEITLKNLREDFVIRMLERYDWPYVSRISGATISSLYSRYKPFMKLEQNAKNPEAAFDEYTLWKLMQAEGASPEGLALWMTREMDIPLKDIAALTWDQVDLEGKVLRLPDREVAIGTRLERMLRQVQEKRVPGADPHVLLTPRAQKAFDTRRLGVVVRQALIRGGLDEVSAGALRIDGQHKRLDGPVLAEVEQKGSATGQELMDALGIGKTQVETTLRRLTEQGKLVRVGRKYYKAGTVVPPAQQHARIRAYIEEHGSACRQELAMLLNVDARPCGWILNGMVEQGTLVRKGRRYWLPEGEEKTKR